MPPLWKAVSSPASPRAGLELPSENVPPVPSRTFNCDSRTFKRLQAAGRSKFVISPVGLVASIIYTVANCTDLTYTAFVVALSVAFNSNGMSMGTGSLWLTVCDLVGSAIYFLDLWMGFQLGIIARWEGRAVIVQNWAVSAQFYTRRGTFWTDMLACLPIFAQIAVASTGSTAPLLRLIATLRLLRLIRVVRLLANLSRSSVGGSHMRLLASALTTRKLLLVHAIFSLAVLVNLLGCIWWNVAVGEGLENSWAAAVNKDFDLLTANDPTRWLVSCYFALTTIVTIGYGDIVPVTVKEIGVVLVFQLVGVAMFAYLLNTASSLLAASGPAARRVEAVRQKLEEVEGTMGVLEFGPSLRRNIRRFYALAWDPPDGCALRLPQLFAELPPPLRHRLAAQQLRPVLHELRFFPAAMRSKGVSACCHLLGAVAQPLTLVAGQPLESLPETGGGGSSGIGGSGSGSSGSGGTSGSGGNSTQPSAVGSAVYILSTGRLVAEVPTSGGCCSSVQLPSPAVLGLADLLAAAGGPLQSALSSLSPPGWQHAAVATTNCQLWRLDSPQLFAALKQQQPALLAHLARRLLGWLSDGSGAAATSAAVGAQKQARAEQPSGQQHPLHQPSRSATSAQEACLLLKQLAADLESAALAASALDAHPSPGKASSGPAGSKQLVLQRTTAASSAASGWEEGEEAGEDAALEAVAEPAEAAARAVGFVWGD